MTLKLYELLDVAKEHGISLIAGEKGLKKDVQWFRIMENTEVLEYLEENLLIFTTGVAINTEKELIDLVKVQHQKNSSATVLHVGKNIKKIPEELLKYCNEHNYPLLWVPWENSLPRMMKDFSLVFLESESSKKDLIQALKNSISFPDKNETYIPIFRQYGFYEDDTYCMVLLEFYEIDNLPQKKEYMKIIKTVRMILMSSGDSSFMIDGKGSIILLFSNYSTGTINQIISRILKALNTTEYDFLVGVGKNLKGITKISESYLQAICCVKISRQKEAKNCFVNFEDVGIYKILSSVRNQKILKEFYQDTIGILDEYDKRNETNYKEVLKLYIVNNRSVQNVAELLYVHRNTVNYKVSKIEDILGCDLSQVEVRAKLYVAFCIENIL